MVRVFLIPSKVKTMEPCFLSTCNNSETGPALSFLFSNLRLNRVNFANNEKRVYTKRRVVGKLTVKSNSFGPAYQLSINFVDCRLRYTRDTKSYQNEATYCVM